MAAYDSSSTRNSARARRGRLGMTLMELVAVVTIIGVVAAMAATRFGTNAVADVDAQGFARRLALDCLQARRRAISTGLNHLLRFTIVGASATQYVLYSNSGSGTLTQMDDVRPVPTNVTVTTGGTTDMEFTFTGGTVGRLHDLDHQRRSHQDRHRADGHRQGVRPIARWHRPRNRHHGRNPLDSCIMGDAHCVDRASGKLTLRRIGLCAC